MEFLWRKIIISAFSERRRALSRLIVSPAVEKVRSDGVEDAWGHKYLALSSNKIGKVSFLSNHQITVFVEVNTSDRLLYSSNSFLVLSASVRVLAPSTLPLALMVRALSSSTKSSPSAVRGVDLFCGGI